MAVDYHQWLLTSVVMTVTLATSAIGEPAAISRVELQE